MRNIKNENLIIIIPAYLPDKRLINLVEDIKSKVNYYIVVIDDGSKENYRNIFEEIESVDGVYVIYSEKNQGKGIALKKGVKYAKENFKNILGYITCDCDGQHKIEDIIKISDSMVLNKESLILGVRSLYSKDIPIKSKIGNYISSFLFFLITGKKCRDTQTGLRGIPKLYEEIFLKEDGDRYEFEMNFLINMAKRKINFKEVNINTIYFDNNKGTHYRAVKDSLKIFKGIIKYTFSSIFSFFIDILMFIILYKFIFKSFNLGIFISTIISRMLSGMFNFTLNQKWVFNSNGKKTEIIKYAILFFSQMLLSGIGVSLLVNLIKNSTLAKIIVDTSLFFISYFIQKNIIFSNKKEE